MLNIQYEFLIGSEARLVDPEKLPWPDQSVILYAIEGKDIIGRIGAIPLLHIEGVWVREDKRNANILNNLVITMENKLIEERRTAAFAFVLDTQPEMANYLERLNYSEMPMKIYVKALSKE